MLYCAFATMAYSANGMMLVSYCSDPGSIFRVGKGCALLITSKKRTKQAVQYFSSCVFLDLGMMNHYEHILWRK